MNKELRDHPKTLHLCGLLGCTLPAALGYLQLLWWFGASNTPQGDLGAQSDCTIARAVYWTGDANVLIDALVQARWVHRHDDYRLILHDWHEHAPRHVRASLVRRKKSFLTCYPPVLPVKPPTQGHLIPDVNEHNEEQLQAIIRWWNRLVREGLVMCGVNDQHPAKAVIEAFKRSQKVKELRAAFADLPAIERMIRDSSFVQKAGWFRLAKLLDGRNKDREYLVLKLLEGGFSDRQTNDPRGNIAALESFMEGAL